MSPSFSISGVVETYLEGERLKKKGNEGASENLSIKITAISRNLV